MSGEIKFSNKTHSQSFSLTVGLPSWQASTPEFLFQESSLPIRSQFHALSVMCAPYSFQCQPHQTLTEFLGTRKSHSPSKKGTALSQARAGGCSCSGKG